MMYEYLMDNGMTREEYHWFLRTAAHLRPFCVMGNDYYVTNEHLVPSHGPVKPAGEIFGYYVITRQYYERYHLPVMHTETNLGDAERAPRLALERVGQHGPAEGRRRSDHRLHLVQPDRPDGLGHPACARTTGIVNPLGLYDLDRKIRPVGRAYKELVEQWRNILPTESLCLHHMEPEEFDTPDAELLTWGGED